VVCADELGPVIPRSFPPAPGWTADGHRVKAPLDYGRGPEKTWVYGALRVTDGKTVTLTAPSRNSAGYQRLLADGLAANPPSPATGRRRGRVRRSPAANLLARLDTHRDEVLRSLDDTRVPVDNNQAERDLRMVKLQQKISGCWRTLAGAEAFLALRSYLATARKHGRNPLAVLGQLFQGQAWLPAPSCPGPA
jgi:hypothetical protein